MTARTPRDVVQATGSLTPRLLRGSAALTLVGLALMVWSMIQPTPMPVILAMSIGQVLGILAFALYGAVVLVDQLRKQRAKGARDARAARSGGVAPGDAPATTSELPPATPAGPTHREAQP